jgi:3-deoxy-7-phosphoheptulonate synthase
MIITYNNKDENYINLLEYLKNKGINYLKRSRDDVIALIIISEISEQTYKKIYNNYNPDNILEEDKAHKFLDETRSIKIDGKKSFNKSSFEIIAGPCSVENKSQMEEIGNALKEQNVKYIRGGAYKPRTSPYQFQGLQEKGLQLLKNEAQKHNFNIVTEVMDVESIPLVADYTDILQIGSRNMYNYSLLKAVGKTNKPVLLKRGMSATYEEFIMAAEYIYMQGNKNIILCERGIRTFEDKTRFTLDLMAIPILKKLSDYPVIVDPSHGTGRWDLIEPAAEAAFMLGAQGIMVEIHPEPHLAFSDGYQSLNLYNFKRLVKKINNKKMDSGNLR